MEVTQPEWHCYFYLLNNLHFWICVTLQSKWTSWWHWFRIVTKGCSPRGRKSMYYLFQLTCLCLLLTLSGPLVAWRYICMMMLVKSRHLMAYTLIQYNPQQVRIIKLRPGIDTTLHVWEWKNLEVSQYSPFIGSYSRSPWLCEWQSGILFADTITTSYTGSCT